MTYKKRLNFKRALLFFITAICCYSQGSSQNSYRVEISTSNYTELTGGTELLYSINDSGYYYSTNLVFPVFKREANFNQQLTPVPSNGAFIDPKGYIAIYESPAYQNTIVLQLFYTSIFSYKAGITKLFQKTEGTAPDRILKFQLTDVISDNDTAQKVNFQAWFHEKDGSISYHFGPSSLKSTSIAGYAGLIVIKPNFFDLADAVNLTGSDMTPQVVYKTPDFTNLNRLNSYPAEGRVYKFIPDWPASVHDNAPSPEKIKLFPNPAINTVNIYSATNQRIYIYNSQGQNVGATVVHENSNAEIDVHNLANGLYFIRTEEGSNYSFRILR